MRYERRILYLWTFSLVIIAGVGAVLRPPTFLVVGEMRRSFEPYFLEPYVLLFLIVYALPCWWLCSLAAKGRLHPLAHQAVAVATGFLSGLIAALWMLAITGDLTPLLSMTTELGWLPVAEYLVMATFVLCGWLYGWLTSLVAVLGDRHLNERGGEAR